MPVFELRCLTCGIVLRVDSGQGGQVLACPGCKALVAVPLLAEPVPAQTDVIADQLPALGESGLFSPLASDSEMFSPLASDSGKWVAKQPPKRRLTPTKRPRKVTSKSRPASSLGRLLFFATSPFVGLAAGYFILQSLGIDFGGSQEPAPSVVAEAKSPVTTRRVRPPVTNGPARPPVMPVRPGATPAVNPPGRNQNRQQEDRDPAGPAAELPAAKVGQDGRALNTLSVGALGLFHFGEIRLPDDTVLHEDRLGINWPAIQDSLPPAEEPAYRPTKTDVFGCKAGRLHGAALRCYEPSQPMMLGEYQHGKREGKFRLWDEAQNLAMVSEYTDNRLQGATTLLEKQIPVYLAFYDQGKLTTEYVVDPALLTVTLAANVLAATPAETSLRTSRTRLTEIRRLMGQGQTRLEEAVEDWFSDWRDQQDGGLTPAQRQERAAERSERRQRRRAAKEAVSDAANQELWRRALRGP